ncbi:PilT protein domain-containing protein [Candidatus Magnetoovum chiemensis]|nr:PilT protein domain-containing protein [Candidatus Magnetoovum chiemensis]
MRQYVIDTHALLWYITEDDKLSPKANFLIEQAEAGEAEIIVPAIVLIESISVISNPRKEMRYNPYELVQWLEESPSFIVSPLETKTIYSFMENMKRYSMLRDDHDRLIIATSMLYSSIPIITKDEKIHKIYPCIW